MLPLFLLVSNNFDDFKLFAIRNHISNAKKAGEFQLDSQGYPKQTELCTQHMFVK